MYSNIFNFTGAIIQNCLIECDFCIIIFYILPCLIALDSVSILLKSESSLRKDISKHQDIFPFNLLN